MNKLDTKQLLSFKSFIKMQIVKLFEVIYFEEKNLSALNTLN